MARNSSFSEKPLGDAPRGLVHWLNPTGEMKVHSLVDKVNKLKNLELAWEKVKRNRGAGCIDGQSIKEFGENLQGNLDRLRKELRMQTYQPQPVKRHLIPKSGQPGKYRPLGIPTGADRIAQMVVKNQLEPELEKHFHTESYGYRPGKSALDAVE